MSKKNDEAKTKMPNQPTVEATVKATTEVVEPDQVRVVTVNGFLKMLEKIKKDIKQQFNIDVEKDESGYFLMQFLADPETGKAGQLFVKGVKVARNKEGQLIVIEPMKIDEQEALAKENKRVQVLSFAGIKDILTQVAENSENLESQVVVELEDQTLKNARVAGPISVGDEKLNVAVPQRVVYETGDEQHPRALFLQF